MMYNGYDKFVLIKRVDSSVDGNQSGVVPLEWKHPLHLGR